MKVEQSKEVKVTLTLNQQEAEWLHVNMQNPLQGQTTLNESEFDVVMRTAFFDATKPR